MVSAVIRPAIPDDLPAINEIYNEAVSSTTASWDLGPVDEAFRRLWFAEHTATGRVLVAQDGDRVVGYAAFAQFRPKAGYRHTMEHTIYLRPEAQGRGLGRRLLTEVIVQARECGAHALIAGLSADNEVSLRLHASLGFVEVGRLPEVGRKFGRWLDLVYLHLFLDAAAGAPR